MSSPRVEAVLLDMGGVLIPEVPDYSGASRNPTLRDHLRRLGVEDADGLVLEAGKRVREAYRELESRCEQPDPDRVLADLPPTIRTPLIRAFADEAAQVPYAYARDVVATLARRYRLGLVSNTIIPGDHHALLREPNVRILAEKLSACIRRAELDTSIQGSHSQARI